MKKILLFISLCTSFLFSQEPLSLARMWQMADSNNYDLQRLELAVNGAALNKGLSKSQLGPKFGVTASYQYQTESFHITMPPPLNQSLAIMQNHNYYGIAWIDWTLFEGLKRFYDIDKAELTMEAQILKQQFVRETLRHQIARLALQAGMLDYEEEISKRSRERISINLNKAKMLSAEGQIAPADTLEFWQGILEVDKHLSGVKKKKKNLSNEIGFVLGIESGANPHPQKQFKIPEEYYNHIAERNDQKALNLESLAIDKQYSAVGGFYWPNIKAKMTWQYDKPGYDPITNDWVSFATMDLSMNWLIWDWNQRKMHREQIQIQQNENQIRQNRLAVERKKNLANLKNEEQEVEENLEITRKQLKFKRDYYQHRKKQYDLAQIDANQLSVTENELSILELTEKVLEMKMLLNKLDRVYVCGNFYRWSNELEVSQ